MLWGRLLGRLGFFGVFGWVVVYSIEESVLF